MITRAVRVLGWLALFVAPGVARADEPRPHRLTPAEVADGWIALCDGAKLFGWRPGGVEDAAAAWRVEDGTIVRDGGPPGLLLTTSEFADFELRCGVRVEAGGNSGLFLRTLAEPADPARDCYEFNVCDTHGAFPTGSLVGIAKPTVAVAGDGRWLACRVRCEGRSIRAWLDDREVLDFTDDRPAARRRGYIGLQFKEGAVAFRDVLLRPLGAAPLVNGRDLAGWHEVPGGAGRFTVVDGAIHVTGGRGFLETDGTWGDFILQARARTNAPGLNSGIFFRAIRGTAAEPANGYEVQIHNGFSDGDRTRPADFGTGGIYRRVPARRVVGDDGAWQTLTLVACGRHVATWVDGEQVVDWTDDRAAADNPRKGARTAAGHVSLQGHDPTTDLDFRDLTIAELPAEVDGVSEPVGVSSPR
ncbi:MAG: DUF1080 domain-containing protein [Planctomycetaceae bacterium]